MTTEIKATDKRYAPTSTNVPASMGEICPRRALKEVLINSNSNDLFKKEIFIEHENILTAYT